jgi:hypothetical protein
MRVRTLLGLLLVAIVCLSSLSVPSVLAQSGPNTDDALVRDAQQYASMNSVDVNEAIRRLQLQQVIGDLDTNLSKREVVTLAGLWIQHTPDFRVIVQLTDGKAAAVQPYIANGPLAAITEVRTKKASLKQLAADRDITVPIVQRTDIGFDIGTNVQDNVVELYVADVEQLNVALRTIGATLPNTVRLVKVNETAKPATDIYGGLAISGCTSGFSVRGPYGASTALGIATAGHCNNSQSYAGVNLPFQNESFSGSYDVQWHTVGSFVARNQVYDGSGPRTINATRGRNAQAINDFACKYGNTTGYTCGYIVQKDFRPGGSLYPPNMSATFIRIHSSGVNEAAGGDSGGPWFIVNTALGITSGTVNYSGQAETDAIYMAIDYVNGLGLTVLTS